MNHNLYAIYFILLISKQKGWEMLGCLILFKCNLFSLQKSVEGEAWPVYLAEYIRQNDQVLLQQSDRFLAKFEEELLPVESFMEFCDVAGGCNGIVG